MGRCVHAVGSYEGAQDAEQVGARLPYGLPAQVIMARKTSAMPRFVCMTATQSIDVSITRESQKACCQPVRQ